MESEQARVQTVLMIDNTHFERQSDCGFPGRDGGLLAADRLGGPSGNAVLRLQSQSRL
jgi:hypothetical protein